MKKLVLISLLFIASSIILVGVAQAKSYSSGSSMFSFFEGNGDKEFMISASGGSYTTSKVGDESISVLQVGGALAMEITDEVQAGAEIGFANVSGGGGTSTFDIMAFGVYNFDTPIKDAMYAKGGVGMFSVPKTATENETKFGFMAGIGRRFPVWDKIQYTPEARLFKKGDADPSIDIQFLNFSVIY